MDSQNYYNDLIEREVNFARMMQDRSFVTFILIGSNIILFIVAILWGLQSDFEPLKTTLEPVQISFFSGLKVNPLISQGQYWRIISSMWVHLGFMHILFNMYGLYQIGPVLEKMYGARRFFIIYMLAGIIGGSASYFLSDNPSGGASGAIYGLVGGLIVVGYKYRKQLPERISYAMTRGMIPWVVFGIGIGFFNAIPMDNAAHIGGLLGGALVTLVMRNRNDAEQHPSKLTSIVVTAFTVLLVAVLLYTAYEWQDEARRCVGTVKSFLQCYNSASN